MSKGKVLVVDDEPQIRSILKLYLAENEYDVLTAGDGQSALEAVDRDMPDVVVLDVMLPDMDGLEVCRRIRKKRDIPIIYVSSLQQSETIVQGLELGGDDYVTKPFDPNELVARLNAVLRRTRGWERGKDGPAVYEKLTERERLILQLIEKGLNNKEIAEQLNLTEGTVKVYNHTIFQKLQVKNRTQAIVRAKEERLI